MSRIVLPAFWVLLAGFANASASPTASDQNVRGKTQVEAAQCVSVSGALLQKQQGKWQSVKAKDAVSAGNLLVALPKAELHSANGAVQLLLECDITKRGPYPVLETAVELKADPNVDLDVRFERGIIILKNLKKKGAAKVRIGVTSQVWEVLLKEPQTSVGLEIYSRHPPGLPVIAEGKILNPMTSVVMLVLEGKAALTAGGKTISLHAPPGTARLRWDSYSKHFETEHLAKLPDVIGPLKDEEKKLLAAVCADAEQLNSKDIGEVLAKLLHSDQKVDRMLAVTAAGALDDLKHVIQGLTNPKHADLRDQAVLVLRNWMGRKPGQVLKLHDALVEKAKFSEVHAKTILQLLFGFSDHERFQPGTYDLLIPYLNHSQLAVRHLAHWNLVRLVPEGKEIAYDAAGSAAERKQAVQQWRQLVPEGKLPQPAKVGEK